MVVSVFPFNTWFATKTWANIEKLQDLKKRLLEGLQIPPLYEPTASTPLVLLQVVTDNMNLRGFFVLNIWFIIECIHANYQ